MNISLWYVPTAESLFLFILHSGTLILWYVKGQQIYIVKGALLQRNCQFNDLAAQQHKLMMHEYLDMANIYY